MITFNSISELKPYYQEETDTYIFLDDVMFNFDLVVDCNIKAVNIKAYDIDVMNIEALNINARDIKAIEITAEDIDALDIKADNINARNIDARNIIAWNIKAWNISYFVFCLACRSFVCGSVYGRRANSIHKCLDGDIVIRKLKQTVTLQVTDEELDKIKKLLESEV